jgi:hypothetical protein
VKQTSTLIVLMTLAAAPAFAQQRQHAVRAGSAEALQRIQEFRDSLKPATTPQSQTPVTAPARTPQPVLTATPGKTGAAAYDDFAEPWRTRFLEAWEKEVGKTKADRGYWRERVAAANDAEGRRVWGLVVQGVEKRLWMLEKNDPPFVGWLWVDDFAVGAFGNPDLINAKVIQIIDDMSMLVGVEHSSKAGGLYSTWVMLKGCPTAGLVDGKTWKDWTPLLGKHLLAVTGTTRFQTVSGGTKTVFVVETLHLERFNASPAELAKRRAEAEAKAAEEAVKAKEERARKEAEEKRRLEEEKEAARVAAAKKAAEEAQRQAEAPLRAAAEKAAAEKAAAAAKAKAEKAARSCLDLTRELIKMGKTDLVSTRLERLIKEYPDTEAAKEAKKLLGRK